MIKSHLYTIIGVFIIVFLTKINPAFALFDGTSFESASAGALQVNEKFSKTYLRSELRVYIVNNDISPTKALRALQNPKVYHIAKSTSFGFSHAFFWLYFQIENVGQRTQKLVLAVDNPHINFIRLYQQIEGFPILIAEGGDGLPFMQRTYIDRRFISPIEIAPKAIQGYMLMVDKRHASVSIPITVESYDSFIVESTRELWVLGIYFGTIILIVAYAIIAYLKTREQIFFWYAFYIFFLGLYLSAYLGLFFQYVHPNWNIISDYSRPVFVTLLSTGLVRFIQLLLKTKQYMPAFEIWYKVLLFLLNVVTLWWVVTPGLHDAQTIYFLNLQYVLILLALLMVLISALVTFKKQKTMVTFFFVAFLAVLAGGLSVILIELGLVSEDIFPMNPLLVGSMIEIMVFAMGLSYWMKLMNDQRQRLSKEIQGVKIQLTKSYISGIETEKKKIAAELHDDIGSKLSYLKRMIEQHTGPSYILNKLAQINKIVRRLSHELSPPQFSHDEFIISLQHLIRSHETNNLIISFQVFDVPSELDVGITKHLYRIVQSALSNIEIHSKATHVDIQIFYNNKQLILAIEDNGIGFSAQSTSWGNGLKSIQNRVEALGGVFEISSSSRFGTSIMITIPD